jgi:hypothetical protein
MKNPERTQSTRKGTAAWQGWSELVQRNLNELARESRSDHEAFGAEEAQGRMVIERALLLSSQALKAIHLRAAMR